MMGMQSLPDGWEARITKEGLTYYIDHINKRSTWVHPKLGVDIQQDAEIVAETDTNDTEPSRDHQPPRKRSSILRRLGLASSEKSK